MPNAYERKSVHPLDEVLPFVVDDDRHDGAVRMYGDCEVKMFSQRYLVFKRKGVRCSKCGIEGRFFALEKHKFQAGTRFHFNLYALDKDGKEVLMTKDHIVPKGKGGVNNLANLQPMCTVCNGEKAATLKEGA